MDFLSNINVPFGFVFILPLLWIIGIGTLILRKNKSISRNAQTFYQPSMFEEINEQCGLDSGGQMINPFDGDARRQLDLSPDIDDGYLDTLRDDDYQRSNR